MSAGRAPRVSGGGQQQQVATCGGSEHYSDGSAGCINDLKVDQGMTCMLCTKDR